MRSCHWARPRSRPSATGCYESSAPARAEKARWEGGEERVGAGKATKFRTPLRSSFFLSQCQARQAVNKSSDKLATISAAKERLLEMRRPWPSSHRFVLALPEAIQVEQLSHQDS